MVKKLDDSMAALSKDRRERVEARVQELAGQVRVGLANKEDVVGGRGAAHLLPAALRNVEDVMPIRSDLEFQQVQVEILAASEVSAGEVRDRQLKALQQRVQAYQQRKQMDPQRLQALDELAAQAQELKIDVVMPNQRTLTGISSIDAEQAAIFNSLGVKKPTANERYANL